MLIVCFCPEVVGWIFWQSRPSGCSSFRIEYEMKIHVYGLGVDDVGVDVNRKVLRKAMIRN